MATNFPEDLDSLINPQSTDSVQTVSHSAQHADSNDAIEALQAKVGVDDSTVITSLDYRVGALEDDKETFASDVNETLTAGSGINKFYADAPLNFKGEYNNGYAYALNDVIIIPNGSPYGVVGSYFIRSGNPLNPGYPPTPGGATNASWTLYPFSKKITLSVDTSAIATKLYADGVGTSSNSYTDQAVASLGNSLPNVYVPISDIGVIDGVASLGPDGKVPASQLNIDEKIQDVAAGLITSGSHTNLTATYDDVTGKINFTAVAQLTQEQIQDAIGPLFTHGSNPNISVTYDDEANKMILEAYVPPSTAKMSPTAPLSPIDGQFWFDTDEFRSGTTRSLKVWNALTATWEYVSTDLSLSTTNTWTSKNTFTNGIIIGLSAAPLTPVHGQIYYNTILNKLKVWDGLLWQDIQGSGGGGGGGLSLIPTDSSAAPSTFFVGLIAPPTGATTSGDLWIDIDDDSGETEFIFAGPNPPAQGTFGTDTLWIDTDDPDLPLIYSDEEPPPYSTVEGDFWVDLDDTSGQSIISSVTAPSPSETEFWLDLTTEEGFITYSDLFKNNGAQVTNFANLPAANNYSGMIAYVSSEGALYVASSGQWVKIYPSFEAETLIWAGI